MANKSIGKKVLSVTCAQVRAEVKKVCADERVVLSRSALNMIINGLIVRNRKNHLFFNGEIQRKKKEQPVFEGGNK